MSTSISHEIDDEQLANAIRQSDADSVTDVVNRAVALYAALDNGDELLRAEGLVNTEDDTS